MNAAEHALKVAALKVLSDLVKAQYEQARKAAEVEFATVRLDLGVKQLAVSLPDGTDLGTISVKAGSTQIAWDEEALKLWVFDNASPEVIERITEAGRTDPDLLAVVRRERPDLVEYVVRDSYRKALADRLVVNGTDGFLLAPETSEATKVATVSTQKPSGAFAFTPSKDAADAVADAWRTGQLGMDGTLRALPEGGGES